MGHNPDIFQVSLLTNSRPLKSLTFAIPKGKYTWMQ